METVLESFFKQYNLNLVKQKVVVAVSTGVDSMVLLDLLMKANLDLDIIVCHVNHKKRLQSDIEEEYIRNFCKEHNLKIYVKILNKEETSGANFQEKARNLRHEFFKEVLIKENAKYLFLAHHLNDDIETILMRIVRSSNLKGYSGIDEYQKYDSYYVLRPLLKTLKNDIIMYAKTNNITYFEDASNSSNDYTRNRFRHNIVNNIFEENSDAGKSFLEFKNTILASSHIINEYRDLIISTKFNYLDDNKGFYFKKSDFVKLNDYIQVEVLFHLLKKYELSKDNILDLIKQIKSEKTNIIFNYKKKELTFVKEYDNIYCYFKIIKPINVHIEITGVGTYNVNDELEIVVSKNLYNSIPTFKKIWYNSNMLPVVIRSRDAGDVINLKYGMKKISRVLIDKKVGIMKRNNILLLTKNNTILAIFDYMKSDELKENNQDDLIIELREKKHE